MTKVQHFLSQGDAESFIHAFISSRLDYCSSLLSGRMNTWLKPAQLVHGDLKVKCPELPMRTSEDVPGSMDFCSITMDTFIH